ESSAALVANAFGYFLDAPSTLPEFACGHDWGFPAQSMELEATVRFPWGGGRHPCLDALILTASALIGVESKRFEPFRTKREPVLSNAYWRSVWGERMKGYEAVRDALHNRTLSFLHLDAVQLVKHAFGLRTAVNSDPAVAGKRAALMYLYCEPETWP